jgi:VCBS repeat-containing protein
MLDASDDLFTISADAAPSKGSVFAENGAGADEGDGPLQVLSINGDSALVGTQITLASSALLRVNADGTYQYDPNGAFDGLSAGQNGADSFTYTVTDVPPFAASLELSALNGANGFKLDGIDGYDFSGGSVSGAGDVNGDGIDDLIIGAWGGGPHGTRSGESYVVFGASTGFAASFDLSALTGANGFKLNGIDGYDFSGHSVSGAGDVNGDGIDDLIIGADEADPNGAYASGESYVVFGASTGFAASFELSALNGANGFKLNGVAAGDESGRSVSGAGDVNGDGIDDLIIGARNADPNGVTGAGQSYVVFGSSAGFAAGFDLSTLNGATGFKLNGIDEFDRSGWSVSGAGDVNGDGIDDLIIGADRSNPNGVVFGESYVVFGASTGFAASVELSALNGANGFKLNGIAADDYSGFSVSGAWDVNGDGIDDLIIGADRSNPNGVVFGESYVVFGASTGFAASVELSALNGANGFKLNGIDELDQSGRSVSGAGDVNGDGIDDLIVGAVGADPNDASASGESYVVFGASARFASSFDLSSLSGANGFKLNGIDAGDLSGWSVSGAGDVNGDGVDDLIIGARDADPNGANSGESYVVFGRPVFTAAVDVATTSFAIAGVNDAPVAQDDALSTDEKTAISGSVLADNGAGADADADGDALTVTQVNGEAVSIGGQITLASGALLTLNADGTYQYDPNGAFDGLSAGQNGADSFA